jgi:hypothetical protein
MTICTLVNTEPYLAQTAGSHARIATSAVAILLDRADGAQGLVRAFGSRELCVGPAQLYPVSASSGYMLGLGAAMTGPASTAHCPALLE